MCLIHFIYVSAIGTNGDGDGDGDVQHLGQEDGDGDSGCL